MLGFRWVVLDIKRVFFFALACLCNYLLLVVYWLFSNVVPFVYVFMGRLGPQRPHLTQPSLVVVVVVSFLFFASFFLFWFLGFGKFRLSCLVYFFFFCVSFVFGFLFLFDLSVLFSCSFLGGWVGRFRLRWGSLSTQPPFT